MRLLTKTEADKVKGLFRQYLAKNQSKWNANPLGRRKLRESQAGNGWTREEWRELVKLYRGLCIRCRKAGALTADHVIPLIRGGKHHISNIQPLCNNCNSLKGRKIIDFRVNFAFDVIDNRLNG